MNINVYLEDELGEEVNQAVEETNRSRNSIIREAVREWLDRRKKAEWPSWVRNFEPLGGEDLRAAEELAERLTESRRTAGSPREFDL